MINTPLLRKAVEWVEEQAALDVSARQWRQSSWIAPAVTFDEVAVNDDHEFYQAFTVEPTCRTKACVAGKLVLDAGYTRFRRVDWSIDSVMTENGWEQIPVVARRLLGAENFDGGLFDLSNTAEDVRRIAEDIAGEKL
jgi:hypothetical protein